MHTASFLLERLYHIFDGALIDEASRAATGSNDHVLKTTVFHSLELTSTEGDVPAVLSTGSPTVIFVVKRVKIL